ncbi:hypothetical protein SAMN06265222_11699 [Neorhodopirellula lusitana]|uniref:Uncharacterized protein n=1 Tax=Neorhodopirellula lusitana TaxID=445327 RepID=A0ABY1QJK7_9BACT|nr:hypothetical protein SAMN06265222_11699 [Neorhodopirellula lusitana]
MAYNAFGVTTLVGSQQLWRAQLQILVCTRRHWFWTEAVTDAQPDAFQRNASRYGSFETTVATSTRLPWETTVFPKTISWFLLTTKVEG